MARQEDLPGMENRRLKDLHEAALDYAEKRDERMALSVEEVELKQRLLKLMHKHKLENYDFEGVHIELVHEEETVKVRVKAAKEEAGEAA